MSTTIRLYDPLGDVGEMQELFGHEMSESPTLPDMPTRLLRARLVFEEAMEFVEACGCHVVADDLGKHQVWEDPFGEPNLAEYADALGDLKVVVYGADLVAGIPAYEVFEEIHRSNMTKVFPDGTVHKREDGKVIKPDTYSPANVAGVLEAARLETVPGDFTDE